MDPDRRRLVRATAVCALGFVAHNGDHARRGLAGTPDSVVWAGTLLLVVGAVVATLVATGHRHGPLAAAGFGFGTAIGVTAAHLLPEWSPLSDPLVDADVGPLTWFAVSTEIAGGLVLGAVATWIVLGLGRNRVNAAKPGHRLGEPGGTMLR